MLKADSDVLMALCEEMPLGVILFGENGVIYCNKKAVRFLGRHRLPEEVETVSKRIFTAIRAGRFEEQFPGDILFSRKYENSPSNWIFRMQAVSIRQPFLSLFITEESLSNRVDLNGLRIQYRLTRRETDVLRRVLNGLRNSDVAEECDITEQTVKDHLSNIYGKLGIKNRVELMHMIMIHNSPSP